MSRQFSGGFASRFTFSCDPALPCVTCISTPPHPTSLSLQHYNINFAFHTQPATEKRRPVARDNHGCSARGGECGAGAHDRQNKEYMPQLSRWWRCTQVCFPIQIDLNRPVANLYNTENVSLYLEFPLERMRTEIIIVLQNADDAGASNVVCTSALFTFMI